MAIITVSRQHGSGGDEIALRLAEYLGYDHVNKELISEIARRASVSESEVERYDEKTESPISRFLSRLFSSDRYINYLGFGSTYLESGVPYYLPGGTLLDEPPASFDRRSFMRFLKNTILDLYKRDNVVIVGRGGQVILRDKPGVVHIRITAPWEYRVARLAKSMGIPQEEAEEVLQEKDKWRTDFLSTFFDVDPGDASLYHLVINSSRVDDCTAIDLIANLVRSVEEKQ